MLDDFRSTSITWDKATRRIYSPITANASDSNGRKLNIQVVNSGQVENLTGATLHLYWETKDKAHDGLDAFDASDISKGEFELFYTTGMLSNVGELNATLVLVDSTGKVVSDWFKITVTRGINEGAIESENSFSSLTQALIDISNLEQNYAPRLNDLTAQLQQTDSRIDNIVGLPEGSTTNDARLEDIKVGYDGTVYNNPGSAVRKQVSSLKKSLNSFSTDILSTNLLDYNSLTNADIDGSTGELNKLGEDNFYVTDFLDVRNVQNLYYYRLVLPNTVQEQSFATRWVFFDVNRAYLSLAGDNLSSVTIPSEAKYVRVRIQYTAVHTSTIKLGIFSNPITSAAEWEDYFSKTELKSNIVATENIKDHAVTLDKIGDDVFIHDKDTNFFNTEDFVLGEYINGTTGAVVKAQEDIVRTDFIELEPNQRYFVNNTVNGTYYALYDEDKTFVSGYGTDGIAINAQGYFDTSSNVKYGRFSFNNLVNANSSYLSKNSGKPLPYGQAIPFKSVYDYPTDYDGDDITVFNKILYIGDSLTFGGINNDQQADISTIAPKYSYPSQLKKMTGVEGTNMSKSGLTSVSWYSTYQDTDTSGHDCCIIQLGVNDFYSLGGWGVESETAFTNIINKIKNENKGIKIFVATLFKGQSYDNAGLDAVSESIRLFVNGLNDKNVILLDMAKYSHLLESKGWNAGHLTAYGYWRLAKDYRNYISWYMNKHKDEFRYIHFIGTDLSYSGGGPNNGDV